MRAFEIGWLQPPRLALALPRAPAALLGKPWWKAEAGWKQITVKRRPEEPTFRYMGILQATILLAQQDQLYSSSTGTEEVKPF